MSSQICWGLITLGHSLIAARLRVDPRGNKRGRNSTEAENLRGLVGLKALVYNLQYVDRASGLRQNQQAKGLLC